MSATITAMPPVTLTFTGAEDHGPLSRKLKAAFDTAMAGIGTINPEAFKVPGMSGRKFRTFLNNLILSMPGCRYMEIGVHQGGSLCSVIESTDVFVTAIDNWSLYGPSGKDCLFNLARFRGPKARISILERDFRSIDYTTIGKHDVHFFDGPHEEQDQYDGAVMPQPAWDDTSIFMVDDWNWDKVRKGTFRGLKDTGVTIDYAIELRTTMDGTTPKVQTTDSDWHNGLFLAVVTKKKG